MFFRHYDNDDLKYVETKGVRVVPLVSITKIASWKGARKSRREKHLCIEGKKDIELT